MISPLSFLSPLCSPLCCRTRGRARGADARRVQRSCGAHRGATRGGAHRPVCDQSSAPFFRQSRAVGSCACFDRGCALGRVRGSPLSTAARRIPRAHNQKRHQKFWFHSAEFDRLRPGPHLSAAWVSGRGAVIALCTLRASLGWAEGFMERLNGLYHWKEPHYRLPR